MTNIGGRFTSEQLTKMFLAKEKIYCRSVEFGDHHIDMEFDAHSGMRKLLSETECEDFVAYLTMAAKGVTMNYIVTGDPDDPFRNCLGVCGGPEDNFVGIYMGKEDTLCLAGFRRQQLDDRELLTIAVKLYGIRRGTA